MNEYTTINDYKNVSAKYLAEDIAEGFVLQPDTIIAYNQGLDDYTLCKIGQTLNIPTPADIDNLAGEYVNSNHFVLVALDPELNEITSPEIPFRFFMIVPYNCTNLHILFDES